MGRLATIVVMFTLLAPVVVCVAPGAVWTSAQPDCCQHMSAGCDSGQSMSECCSLAAPDFAVTAPATKVSTIHIQSLDAIAPSANLELMRPALERAAGFFVVGQSPPDPAIHFIEVLRI